ncbi:hypothetical protein FHG87_010096 [Trinorchestia longiramus]|nr:hypothetical protein FHG87_010096 [Trinorchestia longiramus]
MKLAHQSSFTCTLQQRNSPRAPTSTTSKEISEDRPNSCTEIFEFKETVPRLQEVMMKTSLICLLLLVAVACAEISFSDVLEESVRASASSFDKIDF